MQSEREMQIHRLRASSESNATTNVSQPVADACAWAVDEIERLERILDAKWADEGAPPARVA